MLSGVIGSMCAAEMRRAAWIDSCCERTCSSAAARQAGQISLPSAGFRHWTKRFSSRCAADPSHALNATTMATIARTMSPLLAERSFALCGFGV